MFRHSPSWEHACAFPFHLFSEVHLLKFKGPHETCTQGSSGQRQFLPGSPQNPSPRAPPFLLLFMCSCLHSPHPSPAPQQGRFF